MQMLMPFQLVVNFCFIGLGVGGHNETYFL